MKENEFKIEKEGKKWERKFTEKRSVIKEAKGVETELLGKKKEVKMKRKKKYNITKKKKKMIG